MPLPWIVENGERCRFEKTEAKRRQIDQRRSWLNVIFANLFLFSFPSLKNSPSSLASLSLSFSHYKSKPFLISPSPSIFCFIFLWKWQWVSSGCLLSSCSSMALLWLLTTWKVMSMFSLKICSFGMGYCYFLFFSFCERKSWSGSFSDLHLLCFLL